MRLLFLYKSQKSALIFFKSDNKILTVELFRGHDPLFLTWHQPKRIQRTLSLLNVFMLLLIFWCRCWSHSMAIFTGSVAEIKENTKSKIAYSFSASKIYLCADTFGVTREWDCILTLEVDPENGVADSASRPGAHLPLGRFKSVVSHCRLLSSGESLGGRIFIIKPVTWKLR